LWVAAGISLQAIVFPCLAQAISPDLWRLITHPDPEKQAGRFDFKARVVPVVGVAGGSFIQLKFVLLSVTCS
jgi:hypothetical protein